MNDRSEDRAERQSFAHTPPDFETGEKARQRMSELICEIRELLEELKGARGKHTEK